MLRIRAPKEFWSGLLFVAIGAAGVILALDYPYGSALRMGPGYLPTVLSWCTMALGAVIFLRAFAIDGPPLQGLQWRPLLMVLASIILFGLLIKFNAGLLIAILLTALVGSLASTDLRLVERLALSTGLAVFSVAVFVYGLGQPLDVWPLGWRP